MGLAVSTSGWGALMRSPIIVAHMLRMVVHGNSGPFLTPQLVHLHAQRHTFNSNPSMAACHSQPYPPTSFTFNMFTRFRPASAPMQQLPAPCMWTPFPPQVSLHARLTAAPVFILCHLAVILLFTTQRVMEAACIPAGLDDCTPAALHVLAWKLRMEMVLEALLASSMCTAATALTQHLLHGRGTAVQRYRGMAVQLPASQQLKGQEGGDELDASGHKGVGEGEGEGGSLGASGDGPGPSSGPQSRAQEHVLSPANPQSCGVVESSGPNEPVAAAHGASEPSPSAPLSSSTAVEPSPATVTGPTPAAAVSSRLSPSPPTPASAPPPAAPPPPPHTTDAPPPGASGASQPLAAGPPASHAEPAHSGATSPRHPTAARGPDPQPQHQGQIQQHQDLQPDGHFQVAPFGTSSDPIQSPPPSVAMDPRTQPLVTVDLGRMVQAALRGTAGGRRPSPLYKGGQFGMVLVSAKVRGTLHLLPDCHACTGNFGLDGLACICGWTTRWLMNAGATA